MHISSQYLHVLIILTFCKRNLCQNGIDFKKVFKDKKFDGHSLFTLNGLTEVQCLFECSNEKKSGSVSYHNELKICLVNSIVNTPSKSGSKLKSEEGWIHYEKETNVSHTDQICYYIYYDILLYIIVYGIIYNVLLYTIITNYVS